MTDQWALGLLAAAVVLAGTVAVIAWQAYKHLDRKIDDRFDKLRDHIDRKFDGLGQKLDALKNDIAVIDKQVTRHDEQMQHMPDVVGRAIWGMVGHRGERSDIPNPFVAWIDRMAEEMGEAPAAPQSAPAD